MSKTAAEKFNIIERDLSFMRKYLPKAIKEGKIDRHFAAHKIEVYEQIRIDYLKLMGEQVRKFDEDSSPKAHA